MRTFMRFVSVLVMLAGASAVHAASITLTPSSQTIQVGDTANVTVSVSGLSRGQVVGGFDFFINNSGTFLAPTSITFFNNLGGSSDTLTATTFTSGSAEAYSVSFLDNASLLALQSSGSFDLFRLTYTGLSAGTSLLTQGSVFDLVDGTGAFIPTTFTGASITVAGSGTTVTPEPSSFLLVGMGGSAILAGLKRRWAA